MVKPVKERAQLLVDVSEKVSDDLQIKANPLSTPSLGLATSNSLAVKSGLSSANLALKNLSRSAVRAKRSLMGARGSLTIRPISPVVAGALARRIRNVLPPDGDIAFCLSHEYPRTIGLPWENWNECPFYLCSEYQLMEAVYEWMNSEYEAIQDTLGYGDYPPISAPGHLEDHTLGPTVEELCEAWDMVANDQEETTFLICVYTREGIPIGHAEVSAGWLMAQIGLEKEAVVPTVVIARKLREGDLAAIQRDDEIYLDKGYVSMEVAHSEDYVTVFIEPK